MVASPMAGSPALETLTLLQGAVHTVRISWQTSRVPPETTAWSGNRRSSGRYPLMGTPLRPGPASAHQDCHVPCTPSLPAGEMRSWHPRGPRQSRSAR
jgi:hypothetical protein